MNIWVLKTFLMVLFAFSLAVTSSALTAQVYKTVDKDGNVTYTDQPPADGSKPIELAPISVIEAPIYEKAPEATTEDGAADGGEEVSLKTLRRNYKDFAIVSPQAEESVWAPDGPISVAWQAGLALQEGMQVTIFLDGKRYSTTTQQMVMVVGLERGEHNVSAELRDSRNRTVATTAPVVFFVRQPGLYNRALNNNPNGGG